LLSFKGIRHKGNREYITYQNIPNLHKYTRRRYHSNDGLLICSIEEFLSEQRSRFVCVLICSSRWLAVFILSRHRDTTAARSYRRKPKNENEAGKDKKTHPELAFIPILGKIIHAQHPLFRRGAEVLEALLARIAVRVELLQGVERRGR
jgi:hypothetical protein